MKRLVCSDVGLSGHGWTRRRWLQGSAGVAALAWGGQPGAQPVSAAGEELLAPPLPALGGVLRVPRIALLNNAVYEPEHSEGRFLLVYWWSSTCPFCALQSPSMERLWRETRNRDLQMLALSVDRKPELAASYLKQKGYTFPAAWASPEWRRSFPKPKGLPITLLIGRDGKLLLAEKGQMFAEDVEAIAQQLV